MNDSLYKMMLLNLGRIFILSSRANTALVTGYNKELAFPSAS